MNALITAGIGCILCLFGWISAYNEARIVAFCIFYGFFSAGLITLPPTVIATALCPDMRQLGVRLTQQAVPAGIGLLIGNPIGGAILDRGWVGLQAYAGTTVVISIMLVVVSRMVKFGTGIMIKC